MRRAYEVFTNSITGLFEPTEFALGFGGSINIQGFVSHGDGLVDLNRLWKWVGKSNDMFDNNLPEDKQYLFSERVMCIKPYSGESTTHDSWVVVEPTEQDQGSGPNNLYEEDPADMEDTSYRKYSLSVTYDKYNETARIWLRGFNQFGLPLNKDEMLQDVPEMYVGKTVTVEKHPFTGYFNLTVHPCNQKDIVLNKKDNFSDKNVLVNYLKMWSSVFPCINVLEGF